MNNPICGRCGLRAVRRELERQGVALQFCDFCYWGEAAAEDSAEGHACPRTAVDRAGGIVTPPAEL